MAVLACDGFLNVLVVVLFGATTPWPGTSIYEGLRFAHGCAKQVTAVCPLCWQQDGHSSSCPGDAQEQFGGGGRNAMAYT